MVIGDNYNPIYVYELNCCIDINLSYSLVRRLEFCVALKLRQNVMIYIKHIATNDCQFMSLIKKLLMYVFRSTPRVLFMNYLKNKTNT